MSFREITKLCALSQLFHAYKEEEMESFSKTSWDGLRHFNPSSRHRVGVTGRFEVNCLCTVYRTFTYSMCPFRRLPSLPALKYAETLLSYNEH